MSVGSELTSTENTNTNRIFKCYIYFNSVCSTTIPHGQITSSCSRHYNVPCGYTCNTGYHNTHPSTTNLTCGSTGHWSSEATTACIQTGKQMCNHVERKEWGCGKEVTLFCCNKSNFEYFVKAVICFTLL
jgi:hypothetical protein